MDGDACLTLSLRLCGVATFPRPTLTLTPSILARLSFSSWALSSLHLPSTHARLTHTLLVYRPLSFFYTQHSGSSRIEDDFEWSIPTQHTHLRHTGSDSRPHRTADDIRG